MIKRNQRLLNIINILLDSAIAFLACLLIFGKNDFIKSSFYSALFFFLLSLQGFYNSDRLFGIRRRATQILVSDVIATISVTLSFYLKDLVDSSVSLLLLFSVSALVLTAKYVLMVLLLRYLRSGGWNLKHIAVIGTGKSAISFSENARQKKELGYRVFGFIGHDNDTLPMPLICGFDGLDVFLHDTDADEIVIALEAHEAQLLGNIIMQCDRNGVRYSVIPFENDLLPKNMELNSIGNSRLMSPRRGRLDNIGWKALKRCFDIAVSGFGLLAISPLMLLLAVGVRLSGPGPILFRQTRVGHNRRQFTMLKFRSMIPNDEEMTAWSGAADHRRTGFGKWIRKLSLDELPQLLNVLEGSMSLVGPRPEIPVYVEQYRKTIPFYMMKHQVKPGMTGWAQIHGLRGDTSIEERIKFDLWYIENWSPWLDLYILFKTLFGGMVNKEKLH